MDTPISDHPTTPLSVDIMYGIGTPPSDLPHHPLQEGHDIDHPHHRGLGFDLAANNLGSWHTLSKIDNPSMAESCLKKLLVLSECWERATWWRTKWEGGSRAPKAMLEIQLSVYSQCDAGNENKRARLGMMTGSGWSRDNSGHYDGFGAEAENYESISHYRQSWDCL